MRRSAVLLLPVVLFAGAALSGCDKLGLETPATIAAKKEADGKAVGGACRNAMRAIEDCYTLNAKASKAAVYAGWMEMDAYMRDNKLEGTPPVVPRPGAASEAQQDDDAAADTKSEAKADPKAEAKPAEKPKGH